MTEEQIKNRELSLDIIIPQYKETEEIISPLLDSIEMQASISFKGIKVIIINDHSDTLLSDEFLKSYKHLNIEYIQTTENKGPGQARQLGIDHSNAEYVMFADADDRLFACNLFKEIYDLLVKNKDKSIDIIYTRWIEELKQGDLVHHIPHDNQDMTWLHGKAFRRQFLLDRNLRFNEKIKVHEDSYFNTITQMNAAITATIDIYSYFWCYNVDSLTRSAKYKYNYLVETADDLVTSITDTVEVLEQRKTAKRDEYFIKGVLFMFFLDQAPYWNDTLAQDEELQLRRRRYEYGIFKLIATHKDYLENLPRKDFLRYYNEERAQCLINTGFESEYETWNQYIDRLAKTFNTPQYLNNCTTCKHFKDNKCSLPNPVECTTSVDPAYGWYKTPTKWELKTEEPEVKEKKTTKKKQA